MTLTNLQIRNAAPRDRPYKMADAHGLYLRIHPNGSKYWQMKYRFAGKEKLLSIGTYPEISLARARKQGAEARALLADGGDPALLKQLAKLEARQAQENTFRAVADEYLDKMAVGLENWVKAADAGHLAWGIQTFRKPA